MGALVKEPNLRTTLTIESSNQRTGTEFIYIGQDRIKSDLWRDNRRLEAASSDCHPSDRTALDPLTALMETRDTASQWVKVARSWA